MDDKNIFSGQKQKETLDTIIRKMKEQGFKNVDAILKNSNPEGNVLDAAEAYMGKITAAVDIYNRLVSEGGLDKSKYEKELARIREIELQLSLYIIAAFYDDVIVNFDVINKISEEKASLDPKLLRFAHDYSKKLEKMHTLYQLLIKRNSQTGIIKTELDFWAQLKNNLDEYYSRYANQRK